MIFYSQHAGLRKITIKEIIKKCLTLDQYSHEKVNVNMCKIYIIHINRLNKSFRFCAYYSNSLCVDIQYNIEYISMHKLFRIKLILYARDHFEVLQQSLISKKKTLYCKEKYRNSELIITCQHQKSKCIESWIQESKMANTIKALPHAINKWVTERK